jgi:glycosyltransferase involved in cell wall biosynthesis
LHIAAQVDARGGMGTIIRRHRKTEPDSGFIGLFDRPVGRGPGSATFHLGARAWTTPRQLGRHLAAVCAQLPAADVAVYHNAWGMALWPALDRAARRVAFLHTDLPDFGEFVAALRGRVDGLACLSAAMRDLCLDRLPELDPERCVVLACPVSASVVPVSLARPSGRPLRLGCASRLEQRQKRLDRIAPFLAELDRRRIDWRFDILGDGPLKAKLERQFAREPRVAFLGWQEGADYWRTLAGWDGIIFFSDYEASPLAMSDAMVAGVLPFFPRLGRTQAEVDAAEIDPRNVYPPGDLAAAADQVCQVFSESPAAIMAWREKAATSMRSRQGDAYERSFRTWVRGVFEKPRLSSVAGRTPRFSDQLPIGWLARFDPAALRR